MLQALYGIVEGLSPKTPSFLKYTFSGGYAKNPYPLSLPVNVPPPPRRPFADPDPFQEFTYPSALKAKQAIADELMMPLAKLPRVVIERSKAHLRNSELRAGLENSSLIQQVYDLSASGYTSIG